MVEGAHPRWWEVESSKDSAIPASNDDFRVVGASAGERAGRRAGVNRFAAVGARASVRVHHPTCEGAYEAWEGSHPLSRAKLWVPRHEVCRRVCGERPARGEHVRDDGPSAARGWGFAHAIHPPGSARAAHLTAAAYPRRVHAASGVESYVHMFRWRPRPRACGRAPGRMSMILGLLDAPARRRTRFRRERRAPFTSLASYRLCRAPRTDSCGIPAYTRQRDQGQMEA